MLTRRHAILTGLLPWPGLGQAQQPCPLPVLELEGSGTGAGRIAVFGQAFRPGDLPAGMGVSARMADGTDLPCQVDAKTLHPDGSVRHAVMAMACPALPDGRRAGLTLATARAPAAAPLDLSAALRGRQARVEVRAGGETWHVDLLDALPAALRESAWQRGPLAVQARIERHVTLRATRSLRLVADVAVRGDGTLWVEAWFRNDAAMRPLGGAASYEARVLLDGEAALAVEIPVQHQYTAWGRLLGPAPPARIRHGAHYLAEAGAVARYGVETGVNEAILAQMAAAVAAPEWCPPLGNRLITKHMGQGGARPELGPATQAQAVWLITADRRAEAFAIGQAEAAGAIPWHFWDPVAERWLDSDAWPRLWIDWRGGSPPTGLSQAVGGESGWGVTSSHQPDLSFMPYLLTGRRAFLDNLQAQAAWSVLSQPPGTRGRPRDGQPGGGVNVVRGNQLRGAAWSLRQLEHAAWASPDDDPHRSWLRRAAAGNWAWIQSQIPTWTRDQGEAHGRIEGVYGGEGLLPPWQQDYFASTAAIAARRGDPAARAVFTWMANFLLGRFTAEAKGFSPHDGCAYLIAMGAPGTLTSWADIGAATRAAGLSNGDGWSKSEGNYAQLALQSLAALSDVLGMEEAARVRTWLIRAGAPFTSQTDYRRDPILNIVPRTGC